MPGLASGFSFSGGMRFGIVYPAHGPWCDRSFAEKVAIEAERHGLDSLLVWDHYMLPNGNNTLEAYVLLSYLAGKTSRLKLGTCVTPLPFRNPAMLAKTIATLDVVSGGRAIVGVGAGWHRAEFEGYSKWEGDHVRVQKTHEALKLMIELWTKREVHFSGKYYSASGAVLEPKPLQKPYPQLWFGTTGKKMLKLAARYGSGWVPIDVTAEEYRKCVDTLKQELRDTKKDFVFACVSRPLKGESLAEVVESYARAGCNYFVMQVGEDRNEALEQIKLLGNFHRHQI